MVAFLTERVVGKDCHSMDNQPNLIVKVVFLILETLLSIPLGISHAFLSMRNIFSVSCSFWQKTREQINTWSPVKMPSIIRGGAIVEHVIRSPFCEEIWVIGNQNKIFPFRRFDLMWFLSFWVVSHLWIYDQKWKELYLLLKWELITLINR